MRHTTRFPPTAGTTFASAVVPHRPSTSTATTPGRPVRRPPEQHVRPSRVLGQPRQAPCQESKALPERSGPPGTASAPLSQRDISLLIGMQYPFGGREGTKCVVVHGDANVQHRSVESLFRGRTSVRPNPRAIAIGLPSGRPPRAERRSPCARPPVGQLPGRCPIRPNRGVRRDRGASSWQSLRVGRPRCCTRHPPGSFARTGRHYLCQAQWTNRRGSRRKAFQTQTSGAWSPGRKSTGTSLPALSRIICARLLVRLSPSSTKMKF